MKKLKSVPANLSKTEIFEKCSQLFNEIKNKTKVKGLKKLLKILKRTGLKTFCFEHCTKEKIIKLDILYNQPILFKKMEI